MPRVGTIELIQKETAASSFAAFQQMLQENQIDFFFIGDFNEVAVREKIQSFNKVGRKHARQRIYKRRSSKLSKA